MHWKGSAGTKAQESAGKRIGCKIEKCGNGGLQA